MSEPAEVEILLVEDNPADVELALHALRRHGIANRVQVARDGAEALAFLFGDDAATSAGELPRPRVVLLDLKLPKVDGLQVLQTLKGDPRTRSLPVVVLTSSAEERDLVDSYRLGVNSYITKPVDFAEFAEAMRVLGMYWLVLNRLPSAEG